MVGSIPLPPWVVNEMDAKDMMYKDAEVKGHRSDDYISLGCDMEPVLGGRTPMQVYANFMCRLRDRFHGYLGRVIVVEKHIPI
jgi:beta-amylase